MFERYTQSARRVSDWLAVVEVSSAISGAKMERVSQALQFPVIVE